MKRTVKTYIGKPCDKKGHTVRYVKNRKCVQCNIDDCAKRNKLVAESREPKIKQKNSAENTGAKLLAMRW